MTLSKAQIAVGHPNEATPVDVHFNPATLRITTTNQLGDGSPNEASKPTSHKLDVELLFDTTETGQDIYEVTRALRRAAISTAQGGTAPQSGGSEEEPPRDLALVGFIWGTTRYYGYIESLNETIDYWASDGTPLRSTMTAGDIDAGRVRCDVVLNPASPIHRIAVNLALIEPPAVPTQSEAA